MKIGLTNIVSCKIGSTQVNRVYIGSTLIWSYSAFDPDAQLFITNAVITEPVQQNAVNNLVINLKNYGIWTKMKAIYPFVGGTASQHKFNLKNPLDTDAAYRLTFSGGVTHSANGIQGNAVNAFANTFLPQVSINLNGGVSTYILNNISENSAAIRADNGGGIITQIIPRWTDNNSYIRHFSTTSTAIVNTDSRGFYATSRINNNEILVNFKGTINTFTQTVDTTSTTLVPLYIMAANNVNINATSFGSHQIAFTTIHESITSTDLSNMKNAIETFQTTLSRNV